MLDFGEAAVLCGAGISIEAPSRLPAGGELALRLFDLTADGAGSRFAPDAIAELRREIDAGDLRLEVICDLLSRVIDPITVVSPFGLLRDSPPNRLHLALALLRPAALITTNQDLLLERAGERLGAALRVVHLHGRCDRPRSIVTTVAGYLHGFSPRRERELIRAVDGRDLVVLGYSGRDIDVMSTLMKAHPRRVLWIEHGARRDTSELPPELRLAEQHFGARWTRVGRMTGDWLQARLTRPQRDAVAQALAGLVPANGSASARLSRRFAALDDATRGLAVSHVLRHAGMPRVARAGLARLLAEHPGDGRVALALAEATFELDELEDAIDAFRKVGGDPALRADAVLGEVEALRNLSRYADAKASLARLGPIAAGIGDGAARARAIAAGKCQLGGILRTDGDLDAALDAYRDAELESRAAGDVRGVLESRTWRTEILLAHGRFREALDESAATLDFAPFANARWLTWARFVRGEALCAAGEVAAGLDVLRATLDEFERYGNPMGEAWTLLALGSFLRPADLAAAGEALSGAAGAVGRYKGRLVYAGARLLWEQAELARARRELDAARRGLREYRLHVVRDFPRGHPWLDAHGAALEAELASDAAEPDGEYRALNIWFVP